MRTEAPLDIRILLLLALCARVGQRALACRPHVLGILPDRARAILGLARRPALLALGEFVLANVHGNLSRGRIESDDVAILDQGDRTAHRRFRADVADTE